MRVASLLPSATEMVHFAGAGDALVGVTHECNYPPGVERLPHLTRTKVDHRRMSSAEIDAMVRGLTDEGSLYALDAELLRELRPDLIVTQGLCEVCAVSMGVVERALAGLEGGAEVLSLNPTSIEDVLRDAVRVGAALGRGEASRKKVAALADRLARVESTVSGLPRPRVGCIEWLDPPYSAGHWVPEMVRMAGGEPLFAGPGEPSRRMDWREILEAAPEVLVVAPCGFDVERTLQEAHLLPEQPGWRDLPAVRSGRVWAANADSYFSRPAPRVVDGVEILARMLHPEAFTAAPTPGDAVRLTGELLGRPAG